jgi:hypothetical protein
MGLVLARGPLSARDMTTLHKHRSAQMLTLIRVQADSLGFLSEWRDLGTLHLYGCNFSDWSALGRLKKLKSFHMSGNRFRTLDLSFLPKLKHLEELSIGGIRHWTSFPDMSGCKRLRRLSIFGCPRLTDLSAVLRISSLASFHIVQTPQGPADLIEIMAMPKMKFMTGAFGTRKKDELFRELMEKHNLVYDG